MSNNVMKGIDFAVSGTIKTENNSYVVLIDEGVSSYFPILVESFHADLVDGILSEKIDFNVLNYGLYFSMLSMFEAHDIIPTQTVFMIGKGGVSCYLDVSEENELGVKVSRVPMLLSDAVVLSTLGTIPIVIYGPVGKEFVFKIDKAIPKQNIFSCICEEVVKSERMSAIQSDDDQN